MATVISCPKCYHVRQPDAKAPEWQCPACGVVYAKAADARSSGYDSTLRVTRHAPFQPERRFAWKRWAVFAALGWGAYLGIRNGLLKRVGIEDGSSVVSSLRSKIGGAGTADGLRTLAANTKPGEVTIYTTSWCPHCKAAKQWMQQQGFAFKECDVESSSSCAGEMQSMGGHGVPFLVVRGHRMKDGFDSDEFIAALKRGG